jgi:hypothetical protein
MPKRKGNPTSAEVGKAFESDAKFRTYKNDGQGFDDFEEGQEIIGVLVSMRDHQITDNRTHELKDIRVYSIRVAVEGGGDQTLKIGGRTILDRMFDEIMDEHGGYVIENRQYKGAGYDYLKNRLLKLNRGEDTRTAKGNPLGTYEIAVEE